MISRELNTTLRDERQNAFARAMDLVGDHPQDGAPQLHRMVAQVLCFGGHTCRNYSAPVEIRDHWPLTSRVMQNCLTTVKSVFAAYGSRRFFIGSFFTFLLCLGSDIQAQSQGAGARNALRIGLLTAAGSNPAAASAERGVRLGAAEAKQTA